ncbi:hypothetical protein CDAR_482881 [Caerostris darwini]|uniref:Uncharacterized protein n=1 Tax=Caerostris darwini TaxID=1538125 RepID=A0AAV4UXU8_9ARAC|nr:hypothetical protein CDAR_482881 [Caerostris darwini]
MKSQAVAISRQNAATLPSFISKKSYPSLQWTGDHVDCWRRDAEGSHGQKITAGSRPWVRDGMGMNNETPLDTRRWASTC